MKIRRLIIIVSLLITEIALKAQTNFKPGYVILNSADTLSGEIDFRGDLLMGSLCKFKSNDDNSIKNFSPNDIIGYRFIDNKYFISKDLKFANKLQKKVFLEFLIKGKINIFYYRDDAGDHFFIEKEGFDIMELPYEEGTDYKNDKPYFYKTTDHIGILKYYTQDTPEFHSRIAGMGKPEHKNLIKLAEDYHNKVCKDESCIIYEKKVSFFKLSFEPLVGILNFKPSFYEYGKTTEFGANLIFGLSRSNEKLSFKTGLFHGASDMVTFTRVPLQIQYLYPSGRFRPKISYGYNLYFVKYTEKGIAFYEGEEENALHLPNLSSGFLYRIGKKTYISTNISADYTPLFWTIGSRSEKFGNLSFSFNAGFLFEFK